MTRTPRFQREDANFDNEPAEVGAEEEGFEDPNAGGGGLPSMEAIHERVRGFQGQPNGGLHEQASGGLFGGGQSIGSSQQRTASRQQQPKADARQQRGKAPPAKQAERPVLKKTESAIYHEMIRKHLSSGQLFVFIRKFIPEAHEYGGAYAGQLQTYGELVRYISDNWWRGEKCAFAWTLQDGDDVVATGTIPFSEDQVRQKQIADFLGPVAEPVTPHYPELQRAALPWTAPNGAPIPLAPQQPQQPVMNPTSALGNFQYGAPGQPPPQPFQAPQQFYPQQPPQQAFYPQPPAPQQYNLPPVVRPMVRQQPEDELTALRRRVYEMEQGQGSPGVRQFQQPEEEEEEDPYLQKISELEAMVEALRTGNAMPGQGMPPGVPGAPFQQWTPPGQVPMGMPGHYPQHLQQAPVQPQDEMSLWLAKMKQLKEFNEAMGITPSRDIDSKIREMEKAMAQQQQQHQATLNKMQMDALMEQISALKNERKTEMQQQAKAEPEEKEKDLPPFEDVNGIKIPRDPGTGELDYNFSKIAALNSGMLMEQLVAVLSIYKDNKDSERKFLIAQGEAAERARAAASIPQISQQHHTNEEFDLASSPSPRHAEPEPQPAAPPAAPPAPPPAVPSAPALVERPLVSFVAPPRPLALEDAEEPVSQVAGLPKEEDAGVCAT